MNLSRRSLLAGVAATAIAPELLSRAPVPVASPSPLVFMQTSVPTDLSHMYAMWLDTTSGLLRLWDGAAWSEPLRGNI